MEGENLSWAVSDNQLKVDIGRGDAEMLMVVSLEKNRYGNSRKDLLNIPSEKGFSELNADRAHMGPLQPAIRKSRVCLRARTYDGILTIGGDDVLPTRQSFRLVYSAEDHSLTLEMGLILP